MKRYFVAFLIWLGSALLLFGLVSSYIEVPRYYSLSRGAVETTGIVVAKEPENHQFVQYSYQVDERPHSGIGTLGKTNPPFDRLKPGDTLIVYYDRDNTSSSLLRDPREYFRSLIFGALFLTVGGSGALLFILHSRGWLPGFGRRQGVRMDNT